MKVEIETSEYESFDSEMMWEDEVDIELDNILSDYNLAEALWLKKKDWSEPSRNKAYMSYLRSMLI